MLVAKKMNYKIHYKHISNVISIFIDEFILQLQRKQINIPNFCLFKIEKTKPRKHYNIQKQRFSISTGKFLIKIKVAKSLRREIIQHIDLIKTFL